LRLDLFGLTIQPALKDLQVSTDCRSLFDNLTTAVDFGLVCYSRVGNARILKLSVVLLNLSIPGEAGSSFSMMLKFFEIFSLAPVFGRMVFQLGLLSSA